MVTTSNVRSSGTTLRANSAKTATPKQPVVETAEYTKGFITSKNLRRAKQNPTGSEARGIQRLRDQGFRIEGRRIVGTFARKTTHFKDGQASRVVTREVRNGNIQKSSVENLLTGQRRQINKSGGETIFQNGRRVSQTQGVKAVDRTVTRLEAARMQQKAVRQQTAQAKETARSQFLLRSAQNFSAPTSIRRTQGGAGRQPSPPLFTVTGLATGSPQAPFLSPLTEEEQITRRATRKTVEGLATTIPLNILPPKQFSQVARRFVTDEGQRFVRESVRERERARRGALIFGGAVATTAVNPVFAASAAKGAVETAAIVGGARVAGGSLARRETTLASEPFFKEAVKAGLQKKQEATGFDNKVFTFAESIGKEVLPAAFTSRTKSGQAFTQEVTQRFETRGIKGEQLTSLVKAAETQRKAQETGQTAALLNIARFSEGVGTRGVSKAFGKGGKLGTTPFKTTFAKTFKPIAEAGVIEGALTPVTLSTSKGQKIDFREVAIGGITGGVTAGVFGGTVAGLSAAKKKGQALGLETALSIVDPLEKPGDILQRATERGARTLNIKVTTPVLVGKGASTTFGAKTSTSKSFTVSPSKSKTISPVPVTTPTPKINIGSFIISPTETKSPFPSFTPTPTTTPIPTSPFISTPTTTPVTTPTPTPTTVTTPTPTPTTVTTPIPIVSGQRPVLLPRIESDGGGGGSFKFKFPKRTGQRGGFLPSFAGIESGITQKSAPRFTSGIGFRAPVQSSSSRRIKSIFGTPRRATNANKKKKKKKKKKR